MGSLPVTLLDIMPRLFLGNLGHDCRQRDIEKLFRGYGDLRNINIKGQYGFLEIDDKEDAEDAIKDLNGKSFNGARIKIEFSYAYSGSGDRDRRRGVKTTTGIIEAEFLMADSAE